MSLTTYQPFPSRIPELVYVVDSELPEPNRVVAKYNTIHGDLTRTKHAGPRRPMGEIRAALKKAAVREP